MSYDGAKSMLKMINCGVPLWSILGLLLFLIYINDLVSVCKSIMPIMFVDDTRMEDTIRKELADISTWLSVNRLSLNIKTQRHI